MWMNESDVVCAVSANMFPPPSLYYCENLGGANMKHFLKLHISPDSNIFYLTVVLVAALSPVPKDFSFCPYRSHHLNVVN